MDNHSSTQPAAVRLVISILKRYSPGKREKGREGEREREREREKGGGSLMIMETSTYNCVNIKGFC